MDDKEKQNAAAMSGADGECWCVAASRAEVLIDDGGPGAVPPVAEQQGEPTGSGEEQVDACGVWVVLEVFPDEIADGLGVGDGLSGAGDRLVVCAGGGKNG